MRAFLPRLVLCLGLALPLAGAPMLRADASFEMDLGPQPPPPPPPAPPATPGQDLQTPNYPSPGDGADWIEGHWEWQNGQWVWWPGYWDYPPDPTVVWIYGATVFIDGHYVYQRGHWGRGGNQPGPGRGGQIYPRDGAPSRQTGNSAAPSTDTPGRGQPNGPGPGGGVGGGGGIPPRTGGVQTR